MLTPLTYRVGKSLLDVLGHLVLHGLRHFGVSPEALVGLSVHDEVEDREDGDF